MTSLLNEDSLNTSNAPLLMNSNPSIHSENLSNNEIPTKKSSKSSHESLSQKANNFPSNNDKNIFFIRDKYQYTKIQFSEIVWVQAKGNYLEINNKTGKILARTTLSAFIDKLNNPDLFRTHKSYAINLHFLSKIEPTTVTVLNTKIPISKNFIEELIKRIDVI